LIASFLPYLSHHILFFTRESPKTRWPRWPWH
jgi:hypothetical protein